MAKNNMDGRLLKGEPKLNVNLNEEQKDFVRLFYEYDVNFVLGDFGTGKSLVAVHTALSAFRKKQFNNIWITRPMLKNQLGALPGEIEDKLSPYIFPIIQNLEVCQGKEQTDKMQKEGLIKIMPIEVAKGVTFMKSVVIVDEFQDMSYQDFRTILTRLGEGSKMIFCGSKQQIDKLIGKNSCIYDVMKLEQSNLVGFKTLTSNHRNPILTEIINYLENE
jgi:phosphate starvation-inducible protein PhoH